MPGPTLADLATADPLHRFSARKRASLPVAKLLSNCDSTRNVGHAINRCADHIRIALELPDEGEGAALLEDANLCNRRLCNFCEWRRARAWRARLMAGLPAFIEKHPKHTALFLTLTVRNCQISELADTLRHMHRSWDRLAKRAEFPTPYWFRRTEVTVNRGGAPSRRAATASPMTMGPADPAYCPMSGPEDASIALGSGVGLPATAHPHIHALLVVPPRYFGPDYIHQLRWQQLWQDSGRLDYAPVIDVRRVRAKEGNDAAGDLHKSAILEVAKYCAKAADVANLGPLVPEFHHQMRGHRLFGVSAALKRFIPDHDPDGEELTDARAIAGNGHPLLHAMASWDPLADRYRLRP